MGIRLYKLALGLIFLFGGISLLIISYKKKDPETKLRDLRFRPSMLKHGKGLGVFSGIFLVILGLYVLLS